MGDVPVSRKVNKNKSLPMKLSEDICTLLVCLKNNSTIPRSLVKNGKHDREYLANSRVNSEGMTRPTSINALQPIQSNPPTQASSQQVAASVTMKELNKVKDSLSTLKRDVTLEKPADLHFK